MNIRAAHLPANAIQSFSMSIDVVVPREGLELNWLIESCFGGPGWNRTNTPGIMSTTLYL